MNSGSALLRRSLVLAVLGVGYTAVWSVVGFFLMMLGTTLARSGMRGGFALFQGLFILWLVSLMPWGIAIGQWAHRTCGWGALAGLLAGGIGLLAPGMGMGAVLLLSRVQGGVPPDFGAPAWLWPFVAAMILLPPVMGGLAARRKTEGGEAARQPADAGAASGTVGD